MLLVFVIDSTIYRPEWERTIYMMCFFKLTLEFIGQNIRKEHVRPTSIFATMTMNGFLVKFDSFFIDRNVHCIYYSLYLFHFNTCLTRKGIGRYMWTK
jgi:hypothetical protein